MVANHEGTWCVLCGRDDDGTIARCELHRGDCHKKCHDADRRRRNRKAERLDRQITNHQAGR